ncbi:hypothetical protein CEG14_21070 [Bordetella genomosp. 1]|uniref:Lipoprotein n=2 Tax=Bordetella genomosp. 1 TaxID=1395607 RepID=A0A261RW20_9BORD|nr:hypothetical protein [Bordetella genomosp. 1]OZI29125.1 hypothetical protein CEG14_21070 [Bordetella genomosp. 1]
MNMKTRNLVIVSALAMSLSALAHAQAPVKTEGGVLVDAKGMTLYTFDKDAAGKSNCNDQCAKAWPPLMADAGAKAQGDWTVVKRDDGTSQWAHKGKPVYLYVKDAKPGDKTGDNFRDIWHVIKP